MKVLVRTLSKIRLTTIDNPYNPHTQFEQWHAEDLRLGYNSLGLLARIMVSSDEISIADQEFAYEKAVDEIVTENVLGVYRKIEVDDDAKPVEIR